MKPTLGAFHGPVPLHWELGPPPAAPAGVTLIRWRMEDAPDGGMPTAVAAILAAALTSTARVTFPCSPPHASDGTPHRHGDERLLTLRPAGAMRQLGLRLAHRPAAIALRSTRDPAVAQRLFDDPGFPWWLGQQAALLSAAAGPPPDVDFATILSLFDDDWTTGALSLERQGVTGAIRAAVDGDAVGLLTPTPHQRDVFVDALAHAAAAAGFIWRDEADSAEGLIHLF